MAQPARAAAPRNLDTLLDFINSLDREDYAREGINEAFQSTASMTAWLRKRKLIGANTTMTPRDLARAKTLREGLRALLSTNLGEGDPAAAWRELGEEIERARFALTFEPDRSGGVRTGVCAQGTGMDYVAATMIGILHAALQHGDFERLKACMCSTCRWAFFDASKNSTSKWCSMALCGNRAKARRRRQREGGAPTRGV